MFFLFCFYVLFIWMTIWEFFVSIDGLMTRLLVNFYYTCMYAPPSSREPNLYYSIIDLMRWLP
jgi:hypothetical protein